jgi:PPM family protein phosphatase
VAVSLSFAARSDVGMLREDNEDSGYAGAHVLAIADGMGGAAAGEVASSVAIAEFAQLDDGDQQGDLLAALREGFMRAQDNLAALVEREPALQGMGTTLTVVLRSGTRIGLLHVGDSRGYVLRDGTLEQITHDHTLVQTLVDAGRITADEARVHPQRNIITRTLDGTGSIEPDLSLRELRVGDRLLLCSDGLSGVVSKDTLTEVLTAADLPARAADDLVSLALRAGSPDNVTCVVADVVDGDSAGSAPAAVGAVSLTKSSQRIKLPDSPASRAARLGAPATAEEDVDGHRRRAPSRRVVLLLAVGMLVVGIAVGAVVGWYAWARQQYYVGPSSTDAGATVAVFRGPAQELFGLPLSSEVEATDLAVATLPDFERQQLESTIPARSLDDARAIVDRLSTEAAACMAARPPAGCPVTP